MNGFHYWYAWAPEAFLALCGVIVVIWKSLRVLFRIDAALPTLLHIAKEFEGDDSIKGALRVMTDALAEHSRQDEIRFARLEGILTGRGVAVHVDSDGAVHVVEEKAASSKGSTTT